VINITSCIKKYTIGLTFLSIISDGQQLKLKQSKNCNYFELKQVCVVSTINIFFVVWDNRVGQEIFLKLHSNGYLKKMPVEQVYCQPCKRFLSDRFVEGTCPACNYEDARGDQCDKCGRLTNSVELKNPRCKVCTSTDVTTQSSDQVLN